MEVVRTCVEIPGYELFRYLGEDGNRYDVHSGHVNSYLKEITGRDVTAKDFRTWAATVLCAQELEGAQFEKPTQAKRNIDRKSTRLNSSHVASSYAVFCLKKNSM